MEAVIDPIPTLSSVSAQVLTPVKSAHRLDHLDAIRGLAALSVICFHYNLTYGIPYDRPLISQTPLHLWWDGFAAVSLFFVLSGLVLSLGHFRRSPAPTLQSFSYLAYIVSRICRILLPYLVTLVLAAFLWRYSARLLPNGPPRSPWFGELWREQPTLRTVLRQANLFTIAGSYTLIPQAWSLAIEIVISLLVPLGVLVAGRSVVWLLLGAVVMVDLGGMSPYVFHFALGIAIAKNYTTIVQWLEPRIGWRVGLLLSGLLLYSYRYVAPGCAALHESNTNIHLPGIGAAILLCTVSASPRGRGWLSRGIVHHIGRISYSLYLCHFAILLAITPRIMAAVSHHVHLPWIALWTLGLLFTCLSSIGVADLLYRLVEVPTIALGRWLSAETATLFAPARL